MSQVIQNERKLSSPDSFRLGTRTAHQSQNKKHSIIEYTLNSGNNFNWTLSCGKSIPNQTIKKCRRDSKDGQESSHGFLRQKENGSCVRICHTRNPKNEHQKQKNLKGKGGPTPTPNKNMCGAFLDNTFLIKKYYSI